MSKLYNVVFKLCVTVPTNVSQLCSNKESSKNPKLHSATSGSAARTWRQLWEKVSFFDVTKCWPISGVLDGSCSGSSLCWFNVIAPERARDALVNNVFFYCRGQRLKNTGGLSVSHAGSKLSHVHLSKRPFVLFDLYWLFKTSIKTSVALSELWKFMKWNLWKKWKMMKCFSFNVPY